MVKLASKGQIKENFIAYVYRKFKGLALFIGSLLFFYILAAIVDAINIRFIDSILSLGILVPILVLIFTYIDWDFLKKTKAENYRLWMFTFKFGNKTIFLNMALNAVFFTVIFLFTNMLGVSYAMAQGESSAVVLFVLLIIPYLIIDLILCLAMASIIYFKNK